MATISDCQHHLTDRIVHTTGFYTPVVEHWLERKTAQWVSWQLSNTFYTHTHEEKEEEEEEEEEESYTFSEK